MEILDGKALAHQIMEELQVEVEYMNSFLPRPPHLVAVLIGDNPASKSYVGNKIRSCEKVGFKSTMIERDSSVTEEDVLKIVRELNEDDDVDGFIVQLPLPKHIDTKDILIAIDPKKDVDGFHPFNMGCMVQGLDCYIPATPYGIIKILERYSIETEGKHVVVLGRSNIVGSPMSILLSRKAYPGNATVTLTHSRTKNMKEILLDADIIIAAIGIPNFVKGDSVKEGAVIIDVGINRVDDPSRKRGYRLVGDVDFEAVSSKASYITPVPGGVGPMTVTALLMNTLKSYKQKFKVKDVVEEG